MADSQIWYRLLPTAATFNFRNSCSTAQSARSGAAGLQPSPLVRNFDLAATRHRGTCQATQSGLLIRPGSAHEGFLGGFHSGFLS